MFDGGLVGGGVVVPATLLCLLRSSGDFRHAVAVAVAFAAAESGGQTARAQIE